MALRHRISSPLEAGPSILDAHQLPSHLHPALEYASRRLARKDLHITLVVARREYQLQTSPLPAAAHAVSSPPASPATAPSSAASTPSRAGFASHMTALKRLARARTLPTLGPLADKAARDAREPQWGTTPAPATSLPPAETSPRLWWPLSPAPATPALSATTTTTASSTTGTDYSPSGERGAFGLRLVHASPLDCRTEKLLRQTTEKAQRKFHIGPEWLPAAVPPSACGLTPDLVRRSVAQNEVLFACEGLTLLSLDHLYTFKSALASYAATGSAFRLEDAVDELRRYVLAGRRPRRLRRGLLARSYGWLDVGGGGAALADVARMYRRAYGGAERDCGIEDDADPLLSNPPAVAAARPPPRQDEEWPLRRGPEVAGKPLPELPELPDAAAKPRPRPLPTVAPLDIGEPEAEEPAGESPAVAGEGKADSLATPTTSSPALPPTPGSPFKGPVLKLQTSFATPVLRRPTAQRPAAVAPAQAADDAMPVHLGADEGDSDGDLTARPDSKTLVAGGFWNGASIDRLLSGGRRGGGGAGEDEDDRLGPMTPRGYDDISPITRGEWGFLTAGDAWKARTVAVETC